MKGQKRPIERNSVGHIVCRAVAVYKDKLGKEIQKIFHATHETDIEKTLRKVHTSLGHASSEKMKSIMQNSTLWKKIDQSNMMKRIIDLMTNCKSIKEEERPSDERKCTVTGQSEKFNGRIAVDLSE